MDYTTIAVSQTTKQYLDALKARLEEPTYDSVIKRIIFTPVRELYMPQTLSATVESGKAILAEDQCLYDGMVRRIKIQFQPSVNGVVRFAFLVNQQWVYPETRPKTIPLVSQSGYIEILLSKEVKRGDRLGMYLENQGEYSHAIEMTIEIGVG